MCSSASWKFVKPTTYFWLRERVSEMRQQKGVRERLLGAPKWSKFMPNFMRVANDLCDRRIAIAKKDICVDFTWPQDK